MTIEELLQIVKNHVGSLTQAGRPLRGIHKTHIRNQVDVRIGPLLFRCDLDPKASTPVGANEIMVVDWQPPYNHQALKIPLFFLRATSGGSIGQNPFPLRSRGGLTRSTCSVSKSIDFLPNIHHTSVAKLHTLQWI